MGNAWGNVFLLVALHQSVLSEAEMCGCSIHVAMHIFLSADTLLPQVTQPFCSPPLSASLQGRAAAAAAAMLQEVRLVVWEHPKAGEST